MACLVALHVFKDLVKRITEENKSLLAVIKDLKTELGAAWTVGAGHAKDNLMSVAAGSTPDACFSDVVMVPSTMELTVGSSMIMPVSLGSLTVFSNNVYMYANKMRDIHIANFVVDSDAVVRFRSKDDKVVVCDLLVGMRKYSSYGGAQRALIKLIQRIAGLTSMEVDKTLFDTGNSIILMHFQDVVILFNRIGVHVVNDILVSH